ncbi:MAG: EF-hand domain-containing protein [Sphingobium sp.]
MNKAVLIASAALAAIAVPAIAAHHEGDGGHKMMMADMTKADVEAKLKERFAMVDTDKDGAITKEEIKAQRAAKRAERMDAHFKKMDADGNGSISRAEFDTAHADRGGKMKMAMRDGGGDRDGHRKMGHRGHHGMKMGGKMFDMADANNDGKVTMAEAKTAAMTHFDKVDADKNGTITSQERMDYWKAKKADWKAGKSS